MKLMTPPWKTAWYDDHLSDRFFQEMSRLEKNAVGQLGSSAEWINQMVIELGQLAQNMIQLERDTPHAPQIRMAFEKALKLSALSAHLTAALDRADPSRRHTLVQPQPRPTAPAPRREAAPRPPEIAPEPAAEAKPAPDEHTHPSIPLRQTVTGLSRRGLSVAEIEVITGQSRSAIQAVLNHR